jgi:hypothetical protein
MLSSLCSRLQIRRYEWLFTESGHGKGVADGVGAAVKRKADEYVAHGGNVTSTKDLVHILSPSKVLCFLVGSIYYVCK